MAGHVFTIMPQLKIGKSTRKLYRYPHLSNHSVFPTLIGSRAELPSLPRPESAETQSEGMGSGSISIQFLLLEVPALLIAYLIFHAYIIQFILDQTCGQNS